MTQPLTTAEIESMARTWYQKLDVHAPMLELIPMLDEENLEMKFPEATLRGLAAFERWYQGVIRIFFDEVHQVREVRSALRGEEADVGVVVRWEASRWTPPARFSDRIKLDAYQTWKVRRSARTKQPVIVFYSVDRLEYMPDSAKL